jgi:hypothetical protein
MLQAGMVVSLPLQDREAAYAARSIASTAPGLLECIGFSYLGIGAGGSV